MKFSMITRLMKNPRLLLLALVLMLLLSTTNTAAQAPVGYNNGATMPTPINVYLIWYGQWGTITDPIPLLVTNFVADLGNSHYAHINDTFGGSPARNVFTLAGWTVDAYSQGTQIDEGTVYNIVSANAQTNNWPTADPAAVFFVLTSADLNATLGSTAFGNGMCGWHGSVQYFQTSGDPQFNYVPALPNLRFGFVGDPARFSSCAPQFSPAQTNPFGPNNLVPPNDRSGDAMANHLAHELMETANDPDHTAYHYPNGEESADICAFNFGPYLTKADTGGIYNLRLPASSPLIYSHYYLVQQELVNLIGSGAAYCAMTALQPANPVYPNDGLQNVATNFPVRWNDGLDGAPPDPSLTYAVYYKYWPYGAIEPADYTLVPGPPLPCNADSPGVCSTFVQNMPNGNYRWYAVASKTVGRSIIQSPQAGPAFFTVGFQPISTIPPPHPPALQYPFNGAQNVANNFQVQWSDGLDASNRRSSWLVTYAIYYKYWPYGGIEPANYTLVVAAQPCNAISPGVCGTFVQGEPNGNFRWYVIANMDVSSSTGVSNSILSAQSSVAAFTVGQPPQ